MKAKEIAFVVYPVTDLKRARLFYEKNLGLKLGHIFENTSGAWIEYELGSGTLAISNFPQESKPAGGACAGVEVEDFESAVDQLKSAGIHFRKEPFETPVCRMAVIADPDGNALILHQSKR